MTLVVAALASLTTLWVLLAAVRMGRHGDRDVARRLGWTAPAGPSAPNRLVAWLERVGRTKVAARLWTGPNLVRVLELSGSPMTLPCLLGIRVVAAGGAIALAVLAGRGAWPSWGLGVPLGLLALRGPEVLVARAARRRQGRLARQVPDLVELLVATTEAGLSPLVALGRSAELLGPPLSLELDRAVKRVDLGVPWRAALEEIVRRTEAPGLRRLVAALTRSQALGTPIRTTLRTVAEDLRRERRIRAEELARRAPVKMLFPLVFLILPAFLLLTVGPVVLATIRSLH